MLVSKAVKIAIRVYFSNARGFEKQIYDLLMDKDLQIYDQLIDEDLNTKVISVDFSDINPDIYVHYPFEGFDVGTILNCIDVLIDDIIAEFSGE